MAYSPVEISNNLLKRAFDEDVEVSPMKLQKLLYFTASEYAKRTQRPLLDGYFQKWAYGPVVRSVYDEFRSFGGRPIRSYGKDAQGKAYLVSEASDKDLKASVNDVWRAAKEMSAVRLSRITHLPDSAWAKTSDNAPISEEDIRNDLSYCSALDLPRAIVR
jgi:uncharacterized phage-associated protein